MTHYSMKRKRKKKKNIFNIMRFTNLWFLVVIHAHFINDSFRSIPINTLERNNLSYKNSSGMPSNHRTGNKKSFRLKMTFSLWFAQKSHIEVFHTRNHSIEKINKFHIYYSKTLERYSGGTKSPYYNTLQLIYFKIH